MRVLVGIINKSAASPANSTFVYAATVAAGSGNCADAELFPLKCTNVLILFAFYANWVSWGFGFLAQ